jgi:site-specific recombinase XerD
MQPRYQQVSVFSAFRYLAQLTYTSPPKTVSGTFPRHLTPSAAVATLRLYLNEARPVFATQPGQLRLFVSSRSGGPLDDADIARIVAKAAKNARLKKHITPHSLRHACATHLLKGRADIRQIQKLLGHRRLSSTEIYTHVELSDLAEVISRCHPREKRR